MGFAPTGNFARTDTRVVAYYRCYFTGLRELPESYDQLHLRNGSKNGCPLDPRKVDFFFYPIEAVATGNAPVTQSLASAPAARVAAVVPHEDFHAQLDGLPDEIAEAAATLVGFLTAAAVAPSVSGDAELFLQKAEVINRYYDRLSRVYRAERNKRRALQEKQSLFDSLRAECAAMLPGARSFNRCVSAPNNAGLAFDHTYTKYYPLLYHVFEACRRDLPCTVRKIASAPRKAPEGEVARYFEALRLPIPVQ